MSLYKYEVFDDNSMEMTIIKGSTDMGLLTTIKNKDITASFVLSKQVNLVDPMTKSDFKKLNPFIYIKGENMSFKIPTKQFSTMLLIVKDFENNFKAYGLQVEKIIRVMVRGINANLLVLMKGMYVDDCVSKGGIGFSEEDPYMLISIYKYEKERSAYFLCAGMFRHNFNAEVKCIDKHERIIEDNN